MKRTGCVELVILSVLDEKLRGELAGRLAGLVKVEHYPPEHPLDLLRVVLAYADEHPPESMLVITDSPVVLNEEEARRNVGLVKMLYTRSCSIEEIVESVRAVTCEPVPAPCPVDAGLGWLQA